jgi:hypothetical protein
MGRQFDTILQDLQRAVDELRAKGIEIRALNESVEDLRRHSANITAVEADIQAIREEVIEPIKTELSQNRLAGRFSIFGFYVGALGLLVSVLSVIWAVLPPDGKGNVQPPAGASDPVPASLPALSRGTLLDFPQIYPNYQVNYDQITFAAGDRAPRTLLSQAHSVSIMQTQAGAFNIVVDSTIIDRGGVECLLSMRGASSATISLDPGGAILGDPGDSFTLFGRYKFQFHRIQGRTGVRFVQFTPQGPTPCLLNQFSPMP